MRKLRFRAWDTQRNEMFIPTMLSNMAEDGHFTAQRYQGDTKAILMESTGLVDEDKTEIWEGDIIEYCGEYWIVYWDSTHCCFAFDRDSEEGDILRKEMENSIKVIGNIYTHDYLI